MNENTGSLTRAWWSLVTLGCALFVLVFSVAPSSAAIVRQPYLQIVTPTSMTIVWRTDLNSADNSRVQYGTSSGNLNQTATGTAITRSGLNVKDHIVTITGLNAATKYFYNVGTATDGVQGGGTTQHFFVTAPAVGSTTPFRAWVLGDSGDASVNQALVRDAMLTQTAQNPPAPHLILHMGDIAYESGTDSEFTSKHFAVYEDILRHTPLWPTLGNHEALSVNTSLGLGPYYEGHVLPANAQAGGVASGTEAYYAFDYANVHFIVLDSMDSSRAPGSPMLTWLQNDLATTGQDWVIAFWHHPPYSKGGHNSDSAVDSGGRMVDMREIVLPILEAGGVDAVLAGHSHAYERSYLIDGVYGYGTSPNFATPSFNTLLADGHILDTGDGDPSGNGAYEKSAGGTSHDGTVYVVAGHGGKTLSSSSSAPGNHPVMKVFDLAFGSVLLDINGSSLTMRNLRSSGAFTDTVAIDKTTTDPPPHSSVTITNLTVASGKTYVVPATGLADGEIVYIDRSYTFSTVPALVQGDTYIQTANDDKAATTTNFLSFDVDQPVTVFVGHDDRISPKPAWLGAFTDTGENLVTTDTTLSLYAQSFSAGTVTLGGNASGGGFSMYSVVVEPQDGGSSDTTDPTVAMTAPTDEATVSGTITVSATASDNVGVAGVQFHLNGSNLGAEDTTDPFAISWDTTTVVNDTYTLTATARDAAGNTTTSAPITVTVSNASSPPSSVTITNLTVASGKPYVVASNLQGGDLVYIDRSYTFSTVPASVQGGTYIQTANDDKAATTTNFLSFDVDQPVTVYVAHDPRITTKPAWLNTFSDTGQDLVTTDTTLRLFAQSFSAGTITLGGNASGGGFSMYSVVVEPQDGGSSDTTDPTVAMTAPTDEATVSGTITVSATASDNVGVAGVQFHLNGSNLGAEDTTDPFAISWDTTTVVNDTYTLTATARDAAGNTTTSAPITVTVSNASSPPSSVTITNLTVASGKPYVVASNLQGGDLVYIDRSYTFSTVPASVQGGTYIQTANDDKAATTTNFLNFDVDQPVTVYVAHDDRISPKPAWLGAFTDTGENLVTTDTTLSLYAQSFSAGTITLGGNASGGGFSMYSVIVEPQDGGDSGSGEFTAYNDLAWGTGQLTGNITSITSPTGGSGLPSTGQLLDFATGTISPVTLTVTGGQFIGDAHAAQGANPTIGDAFTFFNGKVSGQGVISYINDVNDSLVLTFTSLDANKTYDLTFFAHRDDHGWDRASLVTISGQEAFTNTSSTATDNPDTVNYPGGVLFTSPTSPSTRLPADNDNGYVARFTGVDPGSDGEIVLTISWDGTTGSEYEGKYGSAIRLVEE